MILNLMFSYKIEMSLIQGFPKYLMLFIQGQNLEVKVQWGWEFSTKHPPIFQIWRLKIGEFVDWFVKPFSNK